MEEQIIQAIKEDKLYDFIANNYWRMSQEVLRDLLLEIIYMIYFDYEWCMLEENEKINKHILECLKENREWGE